MSKDIVSPHLAERTGDTHKLYENLVKQILIYLLIIISLALANPTLAGAVISEINTQIKTNLDAIQQKIDIELNPEPEHISPRSAMILIGQSGSPPQSELNQIGFNVAQALIAMQSSTATSTDIFYPGGEISDLSDLTPVDYSTPPNPKFEILNWITDEIAHEKLVDLFIIGHGSNDLSNGEFSLMVGNFPQPNQSYNYIHISSSELASAIAHGIAENYENNPRINVILLSCYSGASVASPATVTPPGINRDAPSRLTDEIKFELVKLGKSKDPDIRIYASTTPHTVSFTNPNFINHVLTQIDQGQTLQEAFSSWTETPHFGKYGQVPLPLGSNANDDHRRDGLTTQATTFTETIETKAVFPKEEELQVVFQIDNLKAEPAYFSTSLIDQSGNIIPVEDSTAFFIPGQSSTPITATLPILLDSQPFTGTVRFLDQEGKSYEVYFDSRHTTETTQLKIQSDGTFEAKKVDNQTLIKMPITILPGFNQFDNYQLRVLIPGDHVISQQISLTPNQQEITFPISLSGYLLGRYNINKISLWVEIYNPAGKRVWQQLISNDDFDDNLEDASHQPPCKLDTVYQRQIIPDTGDVDIYQLPPTDKTLLFSFSNLVPSNSRTGYLVIELLDNKGKPINPQYIVVEPGKSTTLRLDDKNIAYIKISPSSYYSGDIYTYKFVITKQKMTFLPLTSSGNSPSP